MDPERKDPSKDGEGAPEGSQPTGDATQTTTTPDPKYKGLQQALETEKAEKKRLESELARLRGDPSAEEERDALREELEKLRSEIAVRDLKAQYPDMADVIDVALAEGTKLTPGVLATMAEKAKKAGTTTETAPATSGIRNAPASGAQPTVDEERFMKLLREGNLFPR